MAAHPLAAAEDSQLIADLARLAKKNPKLVKSSVYSAPADPNVQIRSWKMNEFKYYDVPSPFPSLARGVFSIDLEGGEHRIVARGYDKFFNIGEVPWTTWKSIEEHTTQPYTLSLKSNGCIIFIVALTPDKLLITSKHSLGPISNKTRSHAEVGEEWLRKYLEKINRSEADLAKVLWDKNWTAVAELCDDSFEEHVLPYSKELTGLHLHGLNVNSKTFDTQPQNVVDEFAEEWGFIRTRSVVKQTIEEVQEFCKAVETDGVWEGEAVEGFVVRTAVAEPQNPGDGKAPGEGKSPYAPGSSFFFKVKFDEPYMMYRDWREVTKMLLGSSKDNKHALSASSLPKGKMRRPETKLYVSWVIGEIKRNRDKFRDFGNGKGIIATRERFLAWAEKEGKIKRRGAKIELLIPGSVAETETEAPREKANEYGKTVIIPVAIPGCGKTTVALALAKIFDWGHTQSDDVKAKKAAPVFVKNVVNLLKKKDVVIADKNNHLKQHRTQLREATEGFSPPIRLVALNWSSFLSANPPNPNHPRLQDSQIKEICSSRIVDRGANHQSLHPDEFGKHEEIVWRFMQTLEELSPSEVDEIIEMPIDTGAEEDLQPEEEIERNVTKAVEGVVAVLGLEMPSEENIREGVAAALAYKTKSSKPQETTPSKFDIKTDDMKPAPKNRNVRYYALVPELNVADVLESVFNAAPTEAADSSPMDVRDGVQFWKHLLNKRRMTSSPHATLIHMKSLENPSESTEVALAKLQTSQALWDKCAALADGPEFEVTLNSVVWDGKCMAFALNDLKVVPGYHGPDPKAEEFVKMLPDFLQQRMHITVGTSNGTIAPFEAGVMISGWRPAELDKKPPGTVSQLGGDIPRFGEGNVSGTQGIKSVRLDNVVVKAKIRGLIQ